MAAAAKRETALLSWGVSASTRVGEEVSGDLHLVMTGGDIALAAAVDGVGHGPEAAVAAQRAIAILQQSNGEGLVDLVRSCHEELKGTRGAVMSVASFDGRADRMTWLGVGNVEAILVRRNQGPVPSREVIFLRSGVVGYRLPALQAAVLPVSRGDIVIFTTDGIRHGFFDKLNLADSPQALADSILPYARDNDDALALVVRYWGWKT
jgi:hypothetical protein